MASKDQTSYAVIGSVVEEDDDPKNWIKKFQYAMVFKLKERPSK